MMMNETSFPPSFGDEWMLTDSVLEVVIEPGDVTVLLNAIFCFIDVTKAGHNNHQHIQRERSSILGTYFALQQSMNYSSIEL